MSPQRHEVHTKKHKEDRKEFNSFSFVFFVVLCVISVPLWFLFSWVLLGVTTMHRTALALLLLAPTIAAAGEFNKVLSPGDDAPAWENLEGTDGKKHSLADLKDRDVVVVVFTCNSCAFATAYEDRLIAFAFIWAALVIFATTRR